MLGAAEFRLKGCLIGRKSDCSFFYYPNINGHFPRRFAIQNRQRKGNAQDKLLMEICAKVDDVRGIDLKEVMEKVKIL